MAESGNSGELMVLALKGAGVSHLFTINGAHVWPVLMGAEEHGLRLIDVRHEQSAAFAAEGWSKVTRGCGVAAVTAGPGVTNSISALAQARSNDSPLFLVGGRAPVVRWGMGSLQEMNHLEVVRSLCKSARTLESPEDAYRLAQQAVREALSARTGPVFADVPLDVFMSAADLPEGSAQPAPDAGAAPDLDQVKAVARLLKKSERPALVAGTSVWWAHAEEELVRFAEEASLPVVLNGMARGMLPPGHRLNVTRGRSKALGEADLVFVVGVPLDFRLNFGQPPVIADRAQLVYVDIDDFRKHRPAAGAVYGDLKRGLAALADACEGAPERRRWLEELAEATAGARRRDQTAVASDSVPVHPARLVAEVERYCDEDAILVGDGGDFVSWAGRLIERRRPGLWLDGGPFGCLGSGPGYAMAAKLAHPDRQVVLLNGDGAFGFSAMEFDSMARHRIPVVCVIGNNGIWATEKHPMRAMLGTSIAADLTPGTRYDKVVEALGGHGELVEAPGQIRPALKRAFESGVPACVNVLCDPEAEYPRSSVLI